MCKKMANSLCMLSMIIILIFTSLICGCISNGTEEKNNYNFFKFVDELEETSNGSIISRKYKGKIMFYYEKLLSKDNRICVATLYCGYGKEQHLVKIRLYGIRKQVEHNEWGYSYWSEEIVNFRQESITTDNPMILLLETSNENGELSQSGYISQWESQEYFEKFIKENGVCIRWDPGEIITKKVETCQ